LVRLSLFDYIVWLARILGWSIALFWVINKMFDRKLRKHMRWYEVLARAIAAGGWRRSWLPRSSSGLRTSRG
jgi:hypothetical protein